MASREARERSIQRASRRVNSGHSGFLGRAAEDEKHLADAMRKAIHAYRERAPSYPDNDPRAEVLDAISDQLETFLAWHLSELTEAASLAAQATTERDEWKAASQLNARQVALHKARAETAERQRDELREALDAAEAIIDSLAGPAEQEWNGAANALRDELKDRTAALRRAHLAMGTVAVWLRETDTARDALAAKLDTVIARDRRPSASEILDQAADPEEQPND